MTKPTVWQCCPSEELHPSKQQENRSQLHYALNFVLAVVRRSACPADDLSACRAGGFVVVDATAEKAAVSLRNPSWDVAAAALRQVQW